MTSPIFADPAELRVAAQATELAYDPQVVGNRHDSLPGYFVERVFDDQWDNTGFYAIAWTNIEARRCVIGIRGSDERLDFIADANLGVAQYKANRAPLLEYIGTNVLGNRITLAGHSLGGGLSQYLSYDAAQEFAGFRPNLVVHTHNGFGGIAGIRRMHGRYDPAVVEGVTYRNLRHPLDPVSRIGGQVGGNVYNLPLSEPGVTPIYAHGNARFLGEEAGALFELLAEAADEALDLADTLTQLGPELSEALRQILVDRAHIAGAGRIVGLLGRVPLHERRALRLLLSEVLPVRRLLQRFAGGMLRRKQKPEPQAGPSPGH